MACLPFPEPETVSIGSSNYSFDVRDGHYVYFANFDPIAGHREDETGKRNRMIGWLAYEGRGVRLVDLAKAFGVNPKTVERLRDQYRDSGPESFTRPRKPRGPSRKELPYKAEAERLLAAGMSRVRVAEKPGIASRRRIRTFGRAGYRQRGSVRRRNAPKRRKSRPRSRSNAASATIETGRRLWGAARGTRGTRPSLARGNFRTQAGVRGKLPGGSRLGRPDRVGPAHERGIAGSRARASVPFGLPLRRADHDAVQRVLPSPSSRAVRGGPAAAGRMGSSFGHGSRPLRQDLPFQDGRTLRGRGKAGRPGHGADEEMGGRRSRRGRDPPGGHALPPAFRRRGDPAEEPGVEHEDEPSVRGGPCLNFLGGMPPGRICKKPIVACVGRSSATWRRE